LYDEDTKLTHFGYREYDPFTGKWAAKDPLLFAGGDSNLYGYVLNDPVNLADPWGLWSINFEFYSFFGGGVTFGKNPDGKYFLSLKPGIGIGGGISFDPDGTSSNYKKDGCYGDAVGFTGGVYGNLPFLSAGYEGSYGVTTGYDSIQESLYSKQAPNLLLGTDAGAGLKATINVGGEFIFVW
jgi:RHS repeat-associated protein